MNRTLALLSGLLLLASHPAAAEEGPAVVPSTPLRVQVTISRFEGERKIAAMPYSLLVNAGDRDNRVALRIGVAVPIANVGKDGPPVTVHDIGTNMDCTATPADNGRFRITLALNYSSVYESDQRHLQATPPRAGDSAQLVRSFTTSFSMLLRNGESGQSLAATDPVTGEVMKIDVSLSVLK